MAVVHPGATLTPHFRDFLPGWVARQPWYEGSGIPVLAPVGFFRFEDPAGLVGIETHLTAAGSVLYQIPMTYRGAPMSEGTPGAASALIAVAEHSVLGTRWIYDAEADPVWVGELLRLVQTSGISDPASRRGAGQTHAAGQLLVPADLTLSGAVIELKRVVTAGPPASEPGVIGVVMGTWQPGGPGTAAVTGCLAVVREQRVP